QPTNANKPSKTNPASPASFALIDGQTQPLDGYQFIGTPTLPTGFEPGRILPGGGRTRLVFQASDPDKIVEIDHVSIITSRTDSVDKSTLVYTIDPTRQPG